MKLYSPDITKPTEVNYYWHEKVLVEPMPKPKQGEWIDKGDYAECSICGAKSGTQFNGVEPVPRKTKFCPDCGAKMKGAE